MSQYFGLSRYLPESARDLDDAASEGRFWSGQTAVTVGGHWMMRTYAQAAAPEVAANLGITLVLGVPFIGGSNLVIWEHARHKIAAMELVRFLIGKEVQIGYSQDVGLLPAQMDALNALYLSDDPFYAVVSQALLTGRLFPLIPLWGLVTAQTPEHFYSAGKAFARFQMEAIVRKYC